MDCAVPQASEFALCRFRRFDANQRGSTLVEAALVAPLMFTLILGVIQYGLIIAGHISLRAAAALTARYVVVDMGKVAWTDGYLCGSSLNTMYPSIRTTAESAIAPILDTTRLSVCVNGVNVGGLSAPQVELTYNMPLLFPYIVPQAVAGQLLIHGTTIMR
jgi:Flp pilus assembly protein TadG